MLDEVMEVEGPSQSTVPALAPFDLDDNDPLDLPFDEEFRAGTMTLSWDPDDDLVVIEVYPIDADLADDAELDPDDPDFPAEEMLIVRIRPGYARAFVARARRVDGTCAVRRPASGLRRRRRDRPRRHPRGACPGRGRFAGVGNLHQPERRAHLARCDRRARGMVKPRRACPGASAATAIRTSAAPAP